MSLLSGMGDRMACPGLGPAVDQVGREFEDRSTQPGEAADRRVTSRGEFDHSYPPFGQMGCERTGSVEAEDPYVKTLRRQSSNQQGHLTRRSSILQRRNNLQHTDH